MHLLKEYMNDLIRVEELHNRLLLLFLSLLLTCIKFISKGFKYIAFLTKLRPEINALLKVKVSFYYF